MMIYLWVTGALAMIAAICGLVAGNAANRAKLTRNFLWLALIGVVMALALAGVTHYESDWITDLLRPQIDKLRQLYWKNTHFMVWLLNPYFGEILGYVIWSVAGCAVWLVWAAGLIAFNCRCAVKSWWQALLGAAAAIAIFCYLWFWGYAGIGALIILFGRISEEIPWGATLAATVIANSLLLLAWTLYSFWGKHKGWRVLLVQLGIGSGSFLLCWVLAFLLSAGYGQWVKYQAVKAGVVPYQVIYNPSLPVIAGEIQKINDFRKQHPLFSLPVDSIYDWGKWRADPQYMVPAGMREYTLQHFNSPEALAYYQYYDNIVNAEIPSNTFDYWQVTYLRNYIRVCAGLAALYLETGEPDKILPQLLKVIPMDQQKLADLPYTGGEFTRANCRMIWYSMLVTLGPDGLQYAPYYRQALDYLKAQKLCLPNDDGVFLAQLEYTKAGSYKEFLALPGATAFSAKGLAYFMSIRSELQKLETDGWRGQALPWDYLGPYKYLTRTAEVSLLLGRTGLALKLYRSLEGKYPATLAELVPKYLDETPVSPLSDIPLIYQLDGNDFTLSITVPPNKFAYSVSSQKQY